MHKAIVVMAATALMAWPLGSVRAEQWKSTDGVMELTLPEGAGLSKVENPPAPMGALWQTSDKSFQVAITKVAMPANVTRLVKKGLEEGMLAELKGRLISSESMEIKGHEVYVMSTATNLNGADVHLTQAVFLHEGQAYKVMSCVTGNDAGHLRRAKECVASLRIIAVGSSGGAAKAGEGGGTMEWNVNAWSQRIGGIALLVLIGAGLVYIVRRASQGPRNSDG